MHKKYYYNIIILLFLLCSCNWNIITGDKLESGQSGNGEGSIELFSGEAPRNLRVSQASYPDRITLSFSSVAHADYYNIYRAEVPSDYVPSNTKEDNLDWNLIDIIPATSGANILYTDNNDLSSSSDFAYVYCVQAGSDYANAFLEFSPEFSSVEKGWLLTSPSTFTASQGISPDYISFAWSNVAKVSGYNIEYSVDKNEWVKVNSSLIPGRVSSADNTYYYYPPTNELGKELYFRVISIQAQSQSSPSVARLGYTYVEGAPEAPTGVSVSQAISPEYIEISWDIPSRETSTEGGYDWSIIRRVAGQEDETILSFNSLDQSLPSGLDKSGDKYTYRDQLNLQPNTVYEYDVKASCDVHLDDGTIIEDAPGASVTRSGFLLSPPAEFVTDVSYTTKDMFITISQPLGFSSDKHWTYNIQGRFNDGVSASGWTDIESDVVVSETVSLKYNFDTVKCNEFQISVSDDNGNTSSYSQVVAPDNLAMGDFKIVSNNPVGTANSNGVYPVAFTSPRGASGAILEIEITKSDDTVVIEKIDASTITDGLNALSAANSPDELFEKFSYRARMSNPFGRITSWTSSQEGWGALTGNAYIKMFEKWILKPWEFLDELPSDISSKWENSSLRDKIVNPSMNSQKADSLSSKYHNGVVNYSTGNVDIGNILDPINTSAADVTFKFTNFGECEELMGNGSYTMLGAKVKGEGKGVEGTITVTSTMYPAVVDFNSLNTINKQFVGNYKLNQNGRGNVDVEATAN